MRLKAVMAFAWAAFVATGSAMAQTYPARPITIVVPYAAGGNVDTAARILQAAIGNSLGQPIIVENRAGAGGIIAGEYVAKSAPDGYTVFIGSNGNVMLGPMTMAKPPYKWDQVFKPVSMVSVATNVLTVRTSLPVKTIPELVAYAKQSPGRLTLGNSGGASINHFMGELFRLKAGITWTEVAYRGNAPAVNDLVAGHVDMGLQQLVETLGHIQAGKLRALAVLGPERSSAIPDVPTMAELGFPDVKGETWNGLFVPKDTPDHIVARLSEATRAALATPMAREKLEALGSQARGNTPEQFRAYLEADYAKWFAVMKDANIKVVP
jgi:tripartite-type tricarboxylate transporter receptor subunit TctC